MPRSTYRFRSLLLNRVPVLALALAALATMPLMLTAAATPANNAFSASDSISTFSWNLADDDQPLITLPDHIGAGVDLSLSYSLDQFQFPLFQSLYYNQRAGKYILMVIPRQGRRTEFIDIALIQQAGANGYAGLGFSENGRAKLLRTGEGTVYTFMPLSNGELRCSQIRDRSGAVISLQYEGEELARIEDQTGRTISFGYTTEYLSSITQTWGAKNKQVWAVAEDGILVAPRLIAAFSRSTTAKHIPSNAIRPNYTEQMAASDLTLAAIFGGPGAVAAANGFEPKGLASQYPWYRGDLIGDDGKVRRGHLSYAMHLYGSTDGTGETALYVPAGFSAHSETPTPTDAAVTFYYPRLGGLTNVTLAVFHVAHFQLSYEGDRVRIGNIGGKGGSVGSYRHSHIEFYRGNTGLPSADARVHLRIDPATVFAITREAVASQAER